MQVHNLKTWPEYFDDLKNGLKDFEVRYNDREFSIGDEVICQEYCPEKHKYSGEELHFTIKYKSCWSDNIIMGTALKVGYCIIGLQPKTS